MPCAGDPAAGAFGKLLIEDGTSPHTFDADSLRFDFLRPETMRKHGRLIGGQGIWGGIYPIASRTRTGHYYCYGEVVMNPSPGMLDSLLKYMVGTEDTDVFYPADCPNKFGMLISRDLEDGTTLSFEYENCEISYWELEARAPQFRQGEGVDENAPDVCRLTLGIVALDEDFTAWPTGAAEPDLPEGATYYPYALHDGTFTLNGAARETFGFKLRYDTNRIPVYANSLTAIGFSPTKAGRKITLDVHLPWDAANDDLYDMAYAGAAATINLAQSPYSSLFSIANFKVPPESPHIIDYGPVHFTLSGQAFGLAANAATTKEFSVTNDVTA